MGYCTWAGMNERNDEYFIDSENNVVDSMEEADHTDVWYGDELFAQLKVNEAGELCIPTCGETTGEVEQKNIGKTSEKRDFRKHSVFENIIWALQNSKMDKDSLDMAAYTAPGIYMYLEDTLVIELAYHNDPQTVLIDGIVEYDVKNKITKVRGLPVFSYET